MGKGASVPDQALVASDGAATQLHPSGFDPSRVHERVAIAAWLRYRAGLCRDLQRWHTPLRNRKLRAMAADFGAAGACILAEAHHATTLEEETARLLAAVRINREIDQAIAMEVRQGTDPQGLDGEAATARAEGIAQPTPATPPPPSLSSSHTENT